MANEVQTTASWAQEAEKSGIFSKLTWFFKKDQQKSWKQNSRLTKAFHLTRKDSIVSVLVSILVVCWAVYYGLIVLNEYEKLNSRADELKNFSSYNITPNSDRLYSYIEGNNVSTINGMISINNNIEEELRKDEIFKQQQKWYYEVLLQNIYLPSLNIWKDPYTKNFNMAVVWQEYLERDKFQDLYLIQQWSDFVKYVWNDADYNKIDSLTLGDKIEVEGNPEYFYTPITISFSSPNKRSFLLLVNKLSMTSNQNNIALLNEFFYYLLEAIRAEKSELIDKLMQDYREEFSSSSSWDLPHNIWELTDEQKAVYEDRVIWYNLYHRVLWDLTWDLAWNLVWDLESDLTWELAWENTERLIDDDIIVKTIKSSAYCSEEELDQICFYNFREKYRNLPYLAYKIWLENQSNRTAWLLEFLQELPSAIAITSFSFEKYSDSSFLNNKEEEYEWKVTFNAYGRNITDVELAEASDMLWKLCFWSTSEQQIIPDLALNRVNETITSLWWNREYSTNVFSLWELQWLFTEIKEWYESMSNYDKMVKLFEIRRMMNDANLCNK